MAFSIVWTITAKQDYTDIMDNLLENFGKKSARNFKNKVDKQLTLISQMPKMYPVTEIRKDVRRCVTVKEVTMYYLTVEENQEVIVLRFYDNRRSFESLDLDI